MGGVSPFQPPPPLAHASFSLNSHHHHLHHLLSFLPLCKHPPSPDGFKTSQSTTLLSPFRLTTHHDHHFWSALLARAHADNMVEKMPPKENTHTHVERPTDSVEMGDMEGGSSSVRPLGGGRVGRRLNKGGGGSMVVRDGVEEVEGGIRGNTSRSEVYRRNREMGSSVRPPVRSRNEKKEEREDAYAERSMDSMQLDAMGDGSSSTRRLDGKVVRRLEKSGDSGMVVVDGAKGRNHVSVPRSDGYRRNIEVGPSVRSTVRSKNEKTRTNSTTEAGVDKKSKKTKASTPGFELRVGLDMCSKNGDVMGAISLYDTALRDNTKLEQYHYNVLLYLCSSAAAGVVQPGKSGSVSSGSSGSKLSFAEEDSSIMNSIGEDKIEKGVRGEFNSEDTDSQIMDGLDIQSGIANKTISKKHKIKNAFNKMELLSASEKDLGMATCNNGSLITTNENINENCDGIHVGEDVKKYALTRGLEIYEKICSEKILLNEAALTSVARMAMAMSDGDVAFEIVKKIKSLGLTLRLRSYGPALFTFCNIGNIDKAFEVEQHMLEAGVCPEEPELAALLRVSIGARRNKKVYYLLQKLRCSVRQVSPSTAELIEAWFKSSAASRVGKKKWDEQLMVQAMVNGGGGWHGLGWLGKGKWSVIQTAVDAPGFCQGCGEKLVAIDIDPIETENFLSSVASIAAKRERHSNFQKFQKWLEYYGPFEAVIDAANIGLFSQRRFSLTKVNSVVNGIRQKLPSKKWPLIIVHNKRIYGGKMDEPSNVKLVEKWKNADALYATPTGSNDDWYWLYAAVKCNALIVTNDEMRDHIFQVLGNHFFPKWKERHQVHFNFNAGGPQFNMPPACSVVIQESQKGHWHIPILSEKSEIGRSGTWLCVTRGTLPASCQELPPSCKERPSRKSKAINTASRSQSTLRTLMNALASKRGPEPESVMFALDAAEKLAGQVINFEI